MTNRWGMFEDMSAHGRGTQQPRTWPRKCVTRATRTNLDHHSTFCLRLPVLRPACYATVAALINHTCLFYAHLAPYEAVLGSSAPISCGAAQLFVRLRPHPGPHVALIAFPYGLSCSTLFIIDTSAYAKAQASSYPSFTSLKFCIRPLRRTEREYLRVSTDNLNYIDYRIISNIFYRARLSLLSTFDQSVT